MNVDNIFKEPKSIQTFEFNDDVCKVFDDMVSRSVPGYANIQETIDLLFNNLSKTKIAIDIGCSTGTTISHILSQHSSAHCIGIDLSDKMLELAKIKCRPHLERTTFKNCDLINSNTSFISEKKPDFIILNLVLQFIRPPDQIKYLKKLKLLCHPESTMVIFEKIIFPNSLINKAYIDSHLQWKEKSGYSKMEIANKRQSLENRLIPYLHEENIELFKNAGFNHVEICYSFLNFRGYVCF